ncbi:hypothetical protein DFS33DRAFT_1387744 [Desarmillaria ectypa]|nr:hypothetical protein DFS33DRAFT_1387744 [Desarmillaria ectypa]
MSRASLRLYLETCTARKPRSPRIGPGCLNPGFSARLEIMDVDMDVVTSVLEGDTESMGHALSKDASLSLGLSLRKYADSDDLEASFGYPLEMSDMDPDDDDEVGGLDVRGTWYGY